MVRTGDGRLAFGFAARAARLAGVPVVSPDILLAPAEHPSATPTYTLAEFLDCARAPQFRERLRSAVEGRIVIVGSSISGEDVLSGPFRFLPLLSRTGKTEQCEPHSFDVHDNAPDLVPGALIHAVAIRSATSMRPVTLAGPGSRALAAAMLVSLCTLFSVRDGFSTRSELPATPRLLLHSAMRVVIALAGPTTAALVAGTMLMVFADLWMPLAYPAALASVILVCLIAASTVRAQVRLNRLFRTTSQYLPRDRVLTLAEDGFRGIPDQRERDVTILLVDLSGFTAFCNAHGRSASEVVSVANAYFNHIQSIIDRMDGCSDKFLGDGVMAFWNGLVDDPAHASKALEAAVLILADIEAGKVESPHRLRARAVLATGRVFVGDVGAKNRKNFTIVGGAVNEAFRLEPLADYYGMTVLAAGATVSAVAGSAHPSPTADRSGAAQAQGEEHRPPSIALQVPLQDSRAVLLDRVKLKGFAEHRDIYGIVDAGDAGLPAFSDAWSALDAGDENSALALLRTVTTGQLAKAARIVERKFAVR